MLKKYSLKTLQLAINKAMALDEQLPSKLQALDGKVVRLVIAPLDVSFFIRFANGELQLLDNYDGQVDTTIRSSPLGLIRLSLLPASKARSLFNDKIRISGDVELGQKIKQLFDELDIDWEGHLAHFTGDVVAYQLGSLVRKGLALTHSVTDSMRQNVTEYLQEELRFSPSRDELVDFYKDVDELSLAVERLYARVTHLQRRHEAN
jgi:ubiquinone biosynthesis protein UbiJ